MARILIADDHAVVRMAVRLLLEKAGHDVVGEAGTGSDAVSMARELLPDLIILDIDLPQLDGFDVLQRLCSGERAFRVLIFSGLGAEQCAIRCHRGGAVGYVSKDGDLSELLNAVTISLAGYTLFPAVSNAAMGMGSESEAIRALSERELSVLRYLARGYRIRDIAQEFLLSEKTISTYKGRLIAKLQVENFVELVELAKRNGVM